MKIILFGANGFLGRAIADALKAEQYEVVSLTHKDCDITDVSSLRKLKIPADVIINCAAKIPMGANDSKEDFMKVNYTGIKNIVEFAVRNKILKIIHCSTLAVNLRPWENVTEKSTNLVNEDNVYAYSKLMGEQINYKNHIILRLPALYGANMKNSIVDKFIKLAKNNETIKVNENFHANFMHIKDIAKYISKIINSNENGIVNVASENPIDLFTLANIIVRETKSSSKIEKVNDGQISTANVNVDRMHKITNFKEMPLLEGLRSVIGNQ